MNHLSDFQLNEYLDHILDEFDTPRIGIAP